MPKDFKRYCEPFFGGGAVYWRLRINKPSVLNDYNSHMIALLKSIKNGKAMKLHNFLLKTKRTKKIHKKIKDVVPTNDYQKAQQFLYVLLNNWGCKWSITKKGKVSGSYDADKASGYYACARRLANPEYKIQLQNAKIKNKNFWEIMNTCSDPDTFMFLDPPYHNTMQYETPFTDVDQILLASFFKENKSKCLMIINKTPLTEILYKDYIVDEYVHAYNINNGKKPTIHLVIKNY